MLQPARTKYRKQQKGRNRGVATRGTKVSFGEYGLKATTRGRLTARQIEAARRAMTRHIKGAGASSYASFRTNPFRKSPQRCEWVTAKGTRSISSPKSGRARCSTKWTGWMSRPRGRRLRLPQQSFRCARCLCSVRWGEGRTRGHDHEGQSTPRQGSGAAFQGARGAAARSVRSAHAEGDATAHQQQPTEERAP